MSEPSKPIVAGTRIGHVHLKVADLERALGFYCGVLGFELMQHRHSLSDPRRAGRCAASPEAGRHRARRCQRPRRQRSTLSARSRSERRRTLPRPSAGRMATRCQWRSGDVYAKAGPRRSVAGAGSLIAGFRHAAPKCRALCLTASRRLVSRRSVPDCRGFSTGENE
jgi:hypothetical protein